MVDFLKQLGRAIVSAESFTVPLLRSRFLEVRDVPSLDYEAIKREIPLSEVLRLIGWQFVWSRAGQERGRCPIHKSESPRSRSFCVYQDGWYCHKCKTGGDQLRLFSEVTGLPLNEATLALCFALRKTAYHKRRPSRYERTGNGEEER